jgi:hypothetical protein
LGDPSLRLKHGSVRDDATDRLTSLTRPKASPLFPASFPPASAVSAFAAAAAEPEEAQASPLAAECAPEQAAFAAALVVDYSAPYSSAVDSTSPDGRSSPEVAPVRVDSSPDDYSADLYSAGSSPNLKAEWWAAPEQHFPDGSPADSVVAGSAQVDLAEVDLAEVDWAELRSAEVDSAAAERYFQVHSPDDCFPDDYFPDDYSAASVDSVAELGVPCWNPPPDFRQAAHSPDALPAYLELDGPYSASQVSPEAQPSPPDEPSPPDAA